MIHLAFLIIAHNDPTHLKRLIEALPASSEIFVHIDAKSDINQFLNAINNPHVHFSKQRINVMWGSYSQMESEIVILKQALNFPVHFDYFITISGLDYPVWSNHKILSYFSEHKGTEFIQGACLKDQTNSNKLYKQHRPFNYKYAKSGSLGSKFKVILRKGIYLLGIKKKLYFTAQGKTYYLYKGSSWWAITHSLAEEVIKYWDSNKEYNTYFHDLFGPDETYVQTIVFNTEFKNKALKSPAKYKKLIDYTPLTFIDYTDNIKILDESDLPRLLASGKMFCRKTITGQSDKLMDMIDKLRNEEH